MSVQFVAPSTEYKESYLEALSEFDAAGEILPPLWLHVLPLAYSDFEAFVAELIAFEEQDQLYGRFSRCRVYWMVDGGTYVGHITLRFTLNEKLLRVGGHVGIYIRPSQRRKGYGKQSLQFIVKEAANQGISELLFTVQESNQASQRMLEQAGSRYENTVITNGIARKRYWIDTKNSSE